MNDQPPGGTRCAPCSFSPANPASKRCFWCQTWLCSACAQQPLGDDVYVYGCRTCDASVRRGYESHADLTHTRSLTMPPEIAENWRAKYGTGAT